jgi:two-component system nitrate/nitrite response regulator NarL
MGMTARQLDVVGELMHGSSNKTIAYKLGISQATVKVHLRSIMKKFGFTNRVQIVLYIGIGMKRPSAPHPPRDVGCW